MSATTRRSAPGDLVGRDFARVRIAAGRMRARPLWWLLVSSFACALALAALRIDILRVRYALGEAIREEKALVQQQRQQTAALETLRDPSRLAELARKRGFAQPERVIDLRSDRQVARSEASRPARSEAKPSEDQTGLASEDQKAGATTR